MFAKAQRLLQQQIISDGKTFPCDLEVLEKKSQQELDDFFDYWVYGINRQWRR